MAKRKNKVQITVETEKGGHVHLNKKQGVWASYAVANGGGITPELLFCGCKFENGKRVQVFVNRENGSIVVDVIDKGARHGCEVLRYKVL